MSSPSDSNQHQASPFSNFPEAIAGDHWTDTLRDGTPVLIRPLREADRERELAFVNGLSHHARRLRFLGDFKQVSVAQIDQLMDLDYPKRTAFIALVHDNGVLKEIGVSRYSATDDDKCCECAVTVADDWQQKGLGVLLMRHLIDVARRNGFKRMLSLDAASNQRMRELADYLGFHREMDPSDATQVVHTLDL